MWDSLLKMLWEHCLLFLLSARWSLKSVGEKKKLQICTITHWSSPEPPHTLICKLTESVGSNALSVARDKQTAINTGEAARNCLPQVSTVVDRRSILALRGEDSVKHLQKTHLLGCYLSICTITTFIKSWWISGCNHAEGRETHF